MSDKCIFRYIHPYNSSKEFQDLCDKNFYEIFVLLLSTPLVYLLILILEKNYCKNKYK